MSTNWSHVDTPQHVTDEASRYATEDAADTDMDADFRSKSRKGPLRVRFSFDDGDVRSRNSVLNHDVDNRAYSADPRAKKVGFDSNGQPYIPAADGDRTDVLPSPSPAGYGSRQQPDRDVFNQSSADCFHPSRQNDGGEVSVRRELRLNPESLYPRLDRFPRKRSEQSTTQLAWERQQAKPRNSESLSSLPQSVEDDVSTTTSGSYSIDFDDVLNASLEC